MTNAFEHAAAQPVLPSIPELWDFAKRMFERLKSHMAAYPGPRRETLAWLVPVEQIVRVLLVTQALTRALMLPRKRPALAQPEAEKAPVRIPILGLARHYQPPPPPPPAPKPWANRPSTPRFRVLVWSFPELKLEPPPKLNRAAAATRVLDVWSDVPLRKSPPPSPPELTPQPRQRIAQRVDALARVLANPEGTIRRLAAYFAREPAAAVDVRAARFVRTKNWAQGDLWFEQAVGHSRRVISVFERAEPG